MQKYKKRLSLLITNNSLLPEEALFLMDNINRYKGSIDKAISNIFNMAGILNGDSIAIQDANLPNQIRIATNLSKKIGALHG